MGPQPCYSGALGPGVQPPERCVPGGTPLGPLPHVTPIYLPFHFPKSCPFPVLCELGSGKNIKFL